MISGKPHTKMCVEKFAAASTTEASHSSYFGIVPPTPLLYQGSRIVVVIFRFICVSVSRTSAGGRISIVEASLAQVTPGAINLHASFILSIRQGLHSGFLCSFML